MKVAYCDPPYLGCAHYYPEKREVDHQKLILELEAYNGWALSASSPSLKTILAMCPDDVRVGAWVKPFCSFKPNVNPAYAWEPVIFKPARARGRDLPTVRDWVTSNITLRKGLVGVKPRDFCLWLFEILGMVDTDNFIDLFPGSGAVTRAWKEWQSQSRLKLSTCRIQNEPERLI